MPWRPSWPATRRGGVDAGSGSITRRRTARRPPGAGSRFYGDAELVDWIKAYGPDIVLTGHIHQAPFKTGGSWVDRIGDTWVFNSGQQIGPTPAHIAINTRAQEAAWFSLAGAEGVDLNAPLVRPPMTLTALPDWMVAGVEP
jgi:hypothetical protein